MRLAVCVSGLEAWEGRCRLRAYPDNQWACDDMIFGPRQGAAALATQQGRVGERPPTPYGAEKHVAPEGWAGNGPPASLSNLNDSLRRVASVRRLASGPFPAHRKLISYPDRL